MYKGNYNDSTHLMESFCNAFEEAPKDCQNLELFKDYSNFSSLGLIKFVLLSVVSTLAVIILLISGFYYFYRKKINSTFKVELNNKINEALSKYYKEDSTSNYSGIQKSEQLEQIKSN